MFLQDGIEGLCNTMYTIQNSTNSNQMLLVKAKNLNDCLNRPEKIVGAAYTTPCTECKEVSPVVTLPASTMVLYHFWGNAEITSYCSRNL